MVKPQDFAAEVAAKMSIVELVNILGLPWTAGQGHACPTGHASSSGTCCRDYADHAYCFSCKKYFDHIQLVMAVEGISRAEAQKKLSELTGVPLPTESEIDEDADNAKVELADAIAARTEFATLAHEKLTPEDQAYATERGLNAETIEKFLIGSAVPGTIDQMVENGWPEDLLVKSGLAMRDNGVRRQIIENRLTLPTLLPDGRVIDITGRVTSDTPNTPKYMKLLTHSKKNPFVSPHIPSSIPFGAQLLDKECGQIVVVEGPFDAMMLAQQGVVAVAAQTNRITNEQAEYLFQRLGTAAAVTVIPDGDKAGVEGAIQSGLALLTHKIEVTISELPAGENGAKVDPADYFRDKSRADIDEFLTTGTRFLKVLAAQCGSENLPPLQAIEAVKRLAAMLAKILMRDDVLVAADSIIWDHFTALKKTQHRRLIQDSVSEACVRQAAEDSRNAAEAVPAMTDEEREAAMSLLRDPLLIKRICDDLEANGYVGEDENKVLLFLVATSRRMNDPMSANILSPSSAGKTALIHVVALFMPEEDLFRLSRTTPRALYHMPEDALMHRWVVIEERDGLEDAEYPIRTLQSEHKLTLLIPVKDPDTEEIITQEKTVKGPIAFTDATTALSIEEQNATRGFSLTVDITEGQTRKVQRFHARAATREGRLNGARLDLLKTTHKNAQRLLRKGLRVDIPFAELIEFPAFLIRTRRDFKRFLALIQAVAFLHQFQREVKTEVINGVKHEFIEATVADYAIAYGLAMRVILSAVDDLHAHARDILKRTVDWVGKTAAATNLKAEHVQFTRSDLAKHIGIESRALEKYLPDLHHRYLKILSGGQGKTYKYQLASADVAVDATPELNITTPAELAQKIRAAQTSAPASPATSPDSTEGG
ncbi:MAG: toprim domain-containing protein [Planctomycetota bacterium]